MKTVAINRFGGIETLETQELSIPAVGADEVLVRVEAAGVGVWDPFEREGGFAKEFNIKPVFPLVLGSDGAGIVEAVGPQVTRFKKGDRVYGISFLNPKGGFYAQYAVVKENSLALIPGKLTMLQAAAMAVDAVTALAGLDTTLGLKNGESLLIFGASGGIGTWPCNSPNAWARAYWPWPRAMMVLLLCAVLAPTRLWMDIRKTCSALRASSHPAVLMPCS